jgi:hypothetical protein
MHSVPSHVTSLPEMPHSSPLPHLSLPYLHIYSSALSQEAPSPPILLLRWPTTQPRGFGSSLLLSAPQFLSLAYACASGSTPEILIQLIFPPPHTHTHTHTDTLTAHSSTPSHLQSQRASGKQKPGHSHPRPSTGLAPRVVLGLEAALIAN